MTEIIRRGYGDYVIVKDREPGSSVTIITVVRGNRRKASARAREIDKQDICDVDFPEHKEPELSASTTVGTKERKVPAKAGRIKTEATCYAH